VELVVAEQVEDLVQLLEPLYVLSLEQQTLVAVVAVVVDLKLTQVLQLEVMVKMVDQV
tara:strand:- start:55 stop:228 length:174 start_codon:yes stop_codon:yes gene_type:complete